MVKWVTELYASSKFSWKIDNISELDDLDGLESEVFVVGGRRWKAQVYPTESLLVSIVPADHPTRFPKDPVKFSVVIKSQTNGLHRMRSEVKNVFATKTCLGNGRRLIFPFSELYDSSKGYIVNDSCVLRFEVSCMVNKDYMDSYIEKSDSDTEENDLYSSSMSASNVQPYGNSSVDVAEHPGQPFEEGRCSRKDGFCDGGEYEDIGGFSISKTQASLYKQIWAKYGHIPSTKVVPISSYSVLVIAVKDLMSSVIDMHQCRFVDLSTEMVEVWEEKIEMAEKLGFNISWLREHFEIVKRSVPGMQKFKAELLEHGEPLRAAKLKIKTLGDEMKKAAAQLTAAKDYLRENASRLLSESAMETYLEMGENLLFDGMF